MKKTTKVLSLLFVAAAMFMGCKQNAPEEPGKPDLTGDLFSPEETTVDATTVTLSDGSWTIRTVNKGSTMEMAEELDCTVTNNAIDETADFTYKFSQSGTIPEEATAEMIAAYKEMGWEIDGNKGSFYKSYTKNELVELDAKESKNDMEETILSSFDRFITNASQRSRWSGWKTNSDNTKYYCNDSDHNLKIYLKKN